MSLAMSCNESTSQEAGKTTLGGAPAPALSMTRQSSKQQQHGRRLSEERHPGCTETPMIVSLEKDASTSAPSARWKRTTTSLVPLKMNTPCM